jgi:hypothetical protein
MICDECYDEDECITMAVDECKCGEEKNSSYEMCDICSHEDVRCESCGRDMQWPEDEDLGEEI